MPNTSTMAAKLKTRSSESAQKKTPGRLPSLSSGWVRVLLFMLLLGYIFFQNGNQGQEISWQDFEHNLLRRQAIDKIVVLNHETANVYLRQSLVNDPHFKEILQPKKWSNAINPGPHYYFTIGSVDTFERKMDEAQKGVADKNRVAVFYHVQHNGLSDILPWLLPFLLLAIMWRLILNQIGRGSGDSFFGFSKSTATLFNKEGKSTVTFEEVAGLEEAKIEVKEIVEFLKAPEVYTRLGAKIPRGVILVGPPGTGKTLLVKAVAGEAQVPFFSISGSEFVEMFVGVGASRVRDLFKQAKEKAPCIIFIDEIDAIGRSRGRNTLFFGVNDERESTLNQLLTEMDGFDTNNGIIVLAATNRADMLDPALLRPGRFDRHIYLELPNLTEREAIFRVYIKPLTVDTSINAALLAAQTPGFSGADIANICNEAALIAARKQKEKIEKKDFIEAIDRIVAGLEKKSKIISQREKQIIAHHEAGHALASWYLTHVDPLVKVSIVPRGKSLGSAWYLPEERQIKTQSEFSDSLCVALAGRAAEEIIFGELSSGALDDLEKVTKEAYHMVTYYGFNPTLGNISFFDSTEERGLQKPYSEATGKLIDEEVRRLVAGAYQKTLSLLREHQQALISVAQALLQKEVIYREDLEQLLGKRPVSQPLSTHVL